MYEYKTMMAEHIIRRTERGDPIEADLAADLANAFLEIYRDLRKCQDTLDTIRHATEDFT